MWILSQNGRKYIMVKLNKNSEELLEFNEKWWGRSDLNARPPGPKPGISLDFIPNGKKFTKLDYGPLVYKLKILNRKMLQIF